MNAGLHRIGMNARGTMRRNVSALAPPAPAAAPVARVTKQKKQKEREPP
jgi:hypothetical protein